jgi:prepilin signal peptidase PulO-like enzyme (type II secretory pathway)
MYLQLLLLSVLGIVFGSFISALTWRYPRRMSIKKGRSICPNCKKEIFWHDNIPLLSYLILLGKCRNCKKKISLRYPAIELASAIGFVAVWQYAFPDYFKAIYLLIVFVILLSIFVIDLEHQIIPDDFVFAGIFVSILYLLFINPISFFPNIFAGFIAAVFLLALHLGTKGRGMGLGDVKFAVFGGLIVGLSLTTVWLILAFLTGGIVGSILILSKKAKLKTKIAFGPFLILGIFLALTVGVRYMSLLGF